MHPNCQIFLNVFFASVSGSYTWHNRLSLARQFLELDTSESSSDNDDESDESDTHNINNNYLDLSLRFKDVPFLETNKETEDFIEKSICPKWCRDKNDEKCVRRKNNKTRKFCWHRPTFFFLKFLTCNSKV